MANKVKSSSSHSESNGVRHPRADSPHRRFARELKTSPHALSKNGRSISLSSGLGLADRSIDQASEVTISYMGSSYTATKISSDDSSNVDDEASEGSLDCNDLGIAEPPVRSVTPHDNHNNLRIIRNRPSIFEAMSKSLSSFGSVAAEFHLDDTFAKERRAPPRRQLPTKSFTGSSLDSMRKSLTGPRSGSKTLSSYSSFDDAQLKRMIEQFGYTEEDVKDLTEDEKRFADLKHSLKKIGAVTNTSLMLGLHVYLRKEKGISRRKRESNKAA